MTAMAGARVHCPRVVGAADAAAALAMLTQCTWYSAVPTMHAMLVDAAERGAAFQRQYRLRILRLVFRREWLRLVSGLEGTMESVLESHGPCSSALERSIVQIGYLKRPRCE